MFPDNISFTAVFLTFLLNGFGIQCSEDSIGDTIQLRLIAPEANCSNVAFRDEVLDLVFLYHQEMDYALLECLR